MLPNFLESKYDAKTFQNLVYYLYALCLQIIICIVYCTLAQLRPLKLYWFSAVYYQISLEECQTVCVRSFSFAKGKQALLYINHIYKPVSMQSGSPKKNICWYGTQKIPKTLMFIFITTKPKQLFFQLQSMKKQLWHVVI